MRQSRIIGCVRNMGQTLTQSVHWDFDDTQVQKSGCVSATKSLSQQYHQTARKWKIDSHRYSESWKKLH